MKTKQFLLFLFSIILSALSFAQQKLTLTGRVTDAKTGDPLAGASIYFPDLRTGAATNNEGYYIIGNISKGNYLVEVSHLGYSSMIQQIELSNVTQKDFALVSTFIENEAVTVTGVTTATSTKRTPIPVNIVRKENLFNNVSTNLIDNLTKTPGVSQVSTGPAISKPFIRGLGYNRVVVVNDGIRQEGQQWGDEHGIEIDELNVNRVEVLKGPASLMYGSDALAGVINIISIQPVPDGNIRGNVFGAYQANNRQRNFHADLGGNNKGFIWGFYGSYKAAADYKNKFDGYVFNSKFNEKDFGLYTGINKNWGFSHWYYSRFDQEVGLIEGERDDVTGKFLKLVNHAGVEQEEVATRSDFTSINPFIPKQRMQHSKLVTENSFNRGRDRMTVVLGYQYNQRQEFGNVLDPGEKELYFKLSTLNYRVQYHFAEQKNWRTSIGINGMSQSNANRGIEALIPEYSLFDIGAFVFSQKRIKKFTVSGGIRFDNRSMNSKEFLEGTNVKFPAFKKNFSNISGSVGFAYEVSHLLILKFNVARGFRAPAIPELASNGAHEGTNRFEYGEINLDSETSLQTDAGIDISSEHLSFSANIFYNPIRNFIYYRKLNAVGGGDSIIMNGPDQFFAYRFDQNNAKLYGIEFNLDLHPHPLDWLHIENTFSWVRGILNNKQDGSKNLPFIPAARLINELKADFLKKGKSLRNAFFTIELDNTFGQNYPFTGYNTETKTGGYTLLNAGIGSDILRRQKSIFKIFISVHNLTDIAYQNHLSRLKYTDQNMFTGRKGVFNMGRNFSVKLNVPLNFSKKE